MNGKGRLAVCLGAMALAVLAGCSTAPPDESPVKAVGYHYPGLEKTMIVILGASYAAGWNPACDGRITFLNRGASGEQSFEMLARFETDVTAENPRAVILWGYINDIFRTDEASRPAAKERVRESFLEMIRLARAGDMEPLLATEVTIRRKAGFKESMAGMAGSILGKTSYQDRVNGHITELNHWLRELAAAEGLLLLDFERVLAGSDGHRKKEFAKDDGSHIPAAGYAALSLYACDILADHLRGDDEAAPGY